MNQIEEIRSCFDQKIRSGMFKPITRRLHADMAEDRTQDALALVYQQYRRHAEKGEILDDATLVHAARLRAEDLSRQIVPAGGKARKGCVMDLRNYIEGKVEVLRLDQILQDKEECEMLGMAESLAANPVLYRNSSRELSKDCERMRSFGWRDLIGKLGQHWVFSPEFPSVIAP
ncbi:MAG: hypothetical protein WBP56_02365 [Polyangia bacterium]